MPLLVRMRNAKQGNVLKWSTGASLSFVKFFLFSTKALNSSLNLLLFSLDRFFKSFSSTFFLDENGTLVFLFNFLTTKLTQMHFDSKQTL